jgi:polysaccharide biosynthesis/export protein
MMLNDHGVRSRSANTRIAALTMLLLLGGCASLPSSGPTGAQIRSSITADASKLGIRLVQVVTASDLPPAPEPAPVFRPDYTPPPSTELVGPGDVLNVAIFETGVGLFGRATGVPTESTPVIDPAAHSERFPPLRVSDQGTITIPYVGPLNVAGRTTREIEVQLRQALRRKSQNPQVLVSIAEGLTNSVIIGGEIARPGRLVLPTNREKLSDVIALAGGNKGAMKDLVARVSRAGSIQEWRLSETLDNPDLDVRIFPSDRIMLISAQRSFTVLGAAGTSNKFPFPDSKPSLIEAIAMAGGANPVSGNARAIFVFRTNRAEAGQAVPVVYHFNMMNAGSYILAQNFQIKDKDVVYVGNASANQPSKLIQLLSQLFYPLVSLQQAGAL